MLCQEIQAWKKLAQCIPGSVEDNEFLVKVAQGKKSI